MTEKSIDTSGAAHNVAARERIQERLNGALSCAMQRGFYGTLTLEVPFVDGVAQRGMVRVEQHTPILA